MFTITCTTCQARLVVRSEAAIGAILECPKCQSMVHVSRPRSGGQPPEDARSAGPAQASPPPLDHVASDPQLLELGLAEMSSAQRLLRSIWLIWAAGIATAVAIAWGLWWLLIPPAQPPSIASEARRVAIESNRPATGSKRPAAAVVPATPGRSSGQNDIGPPSGSVSSPPKPKYPAVASAAPRHRRCQRPNRQRPIRCRLLARRRPIASRNNRSRSRKHRRHDRTPRCK